MPTEILSGLWIGGVNDSLNKNFIKDNIIQIIINCTTTYGFIDTIETKKIRIPISDNLTPEKDQLLIQQNKDKILDYIFKNIETSNGVVHVIDQVLLPSKMSRRQVMNSLTAAIDRGVPVFNSGHHGQCCDIYMNVMTEISETGVDSMDDHSMSLVKQTLRKARGTRDMTQRAWVLREGMDQLYMQAGRMSDRIGR